MALLALEVPQQTSSSRSTTQTEPRYLESSLAMAHPTRRRDNYCIVHSYRSFPEKNKSKAGTVSGRPFYLALVSGKLFIYIYSIAGHPADCNEKL